MAHKCYSPGMASHKGNDSPGEQKRTRPRSGCSPDSTWRRLRAIGATGTDVPFFMLVVGLRPGEDSWIRGGEDMRDPIPRLCRVFLFLVLAMVVGAAPAFAQGGATSTIAGTVVDSSGAVVPGADIEAKNVATGTIFTAVSGSDGAFTIPAVPPGTYTVTVTLMGFKTAVLNDVIASVAQTVDGEGRARARRRSRRPSSSPARRRSCRRRRPRWPTTLLEAQIASLPVVGPRRVRPRGLHARRRDDDRQPPRRRRSTACRRARSTSRSTA